MTHLMSLHPWLVLFIGMCIGSEAGIWLHYKLTCSLNLSPTSTPAYLEELE